MILDMTLKDDDLEREYHVTVHARVVEEIGGAPGYCVDIDRLHIECIVTWFDAVGLECEMESHFRRHVERYVERMFGDEIRRRCIERFEELKLGAA